ncbi:hypothetical protein L1D44_02230 [Shewanella sp. Isolate13]|uniref:hypothetical protein n=1 Tax=Shewanella sp. Isolate13 TaxID=2908531 RepID=UPI001EFD9E4D|nr:hypothetical protein [Shewanella sp. Isolate13]MCG9728673.1 hypothetical protein [Shewanella sp. Isolate13]
MELNWPCRLNENKQHPYLNASSASMPLVRELDNFVISHHVIEARCRIYTE